MNAAELKAEENRWALKSAREALEARARDARSLADSIDARLKDLDHEDDSPIKVSRSERYTWIINDIENFIRNINFAELARHAANLK